MIRLIAVIATSVALILVVLYFTYAMIRQAFKAIRMLHEDENLIRRNNARASYTLHISVEPHWEKICAEILKKPLGPMGPWFHEEYTTEKTLEGLFGEKEATQWKKIEALFRNGLYHDFLPYKFKWCVTKDYSSGLETVWSDIGKTFIPEGPKVRINYIFTITPSCILTLENDPECKKFGEWGFWNIIEFLQAVALHGHNPMNYIDRFPAGLEKKFAESGTRYETDMNDSRFGLLPDAKPKPQDEWEKMIGANFLDRIVEYHEFRNPWLAVKIKYVPGESMSPVF